MNTPFSTYFFARALATFALCALASAARASTGFTSSGTIDSSSAGTTLENGKVYVVSGNTSLSRNTPNSTLYVAHNATAVIYIPKNVTLTVNGGNASGTESGGAAIRVNAGSTLVVTGGGKLIAKGGNGSNGANGEGGGSGSRSGEDMGAGSGGAGGDGGGGGAAAIGGAGGNGGAGGQKRSSDGDRDTNRKDWDLDGHDGNPGANANDGQNGGQVFLLGTVTVTATGGNAGSAGSAGSSGGGKYHRYTNDYYTGGGGGGGGGGKGQAAPYGIGGGGGGGGGGGSGGSGGYFWTTQTFGGDKTCPNGAGGEGGYPGGVNASRSSPDTTSGYDTSATGGKRGSGGSAGANGSSEGCYRDSGVSLTGSASSTYSTNSHSAIEYTLTFSDATRLTERKNVKLGYALPSASTPLDRPGWTFNGWFTEENGAGTKYYDANGAVLFDEYFNVGDVTLYASWTSTDPSATGTVFVNGTPLVGGRTQSGNGWYYDGGSGYLRLYTDGKRYVVTGEDNTGEFCVWGASSCEVVLSNLTINASQKMDGPPFTAAAGKSPVLMFAGENHFQGPANHPAIYVEAGSTLTIRDGGGTVDAQGGENAPGIGGMVGETSGTGALNIEGGRINATGGSNGPGIGAAKGSGFGTMTISGGTVTASGGSNGSGIGGGNGAGLGTYIISGGTVTAWGGTAAPGIGCGPNGIGGNVTISGGTVKATGGYHGAGIGDGEGSSGCTVTIEGGNVVAAGSDGGAGIGGGKGSAFSSITIKGGQVNSSCGLSSSASGSAAAIGGGNCGTGGAIKISGGVVTAWSSSYSAGIGAGDAGEFSHWGMDTGISVEISGGRISASSYRGAGIGPSEGTRCRAITISGGTVNASGGSDCTAIGKSRNYVATSVTIQGGAVHPGQNDIRPAPFNNASDAVFQVDFDIGEPTRKVTSLTFTGALASYAYGTNDLYTAQNGNLRVYLPSTSGVAFVATVKMESGNTYYFSFGIDDEGEVKVCGFLIVNDTLVSSDADHSGTGWTYTKSTGVLELTANAEVRGFSTNGEFRIVVPATASTSAVTFQSLTLGTTAKDSPAVDFERDITLTLSGANNMSALGNYSAGIEVASSATLTIKGTGSLVANGGGKAAGIGSAGGFPAPGKIVIESGTITATGGEKGAGIGGGQSANLVTNNIVITGGYVTATGGASAAGIGPGYGQKAIPAGAVSISGGTVLATKGSGASCYDLVSSGYVSVTSYDRSLVITGGSVVDETGSVLPRPVNADGVQLFAVTFTNLGAHAAVTISGPGLPADYGVSQIRADGNGIVRLWLPNSNSPRTLLVNGLYYKADTTHRRDVIAECLGDKEPDEMAIDDVMNYRVSVHGFTPGTAVTVLGLDAFGVDSAQTVGQNGVFSFFLPNGDYEFTVQGYPATAKVADAPTDAVISIGISVNGIDIFTGSGTGWAFDLLDGVLTLNGGDEGFLISGSNTSGRVRISVIDAGNVTLSNLVISTSSTNAPVSIASSATVDMLLAGTNRLSNTGAARQKAASAIFVPAGATLRIGGVTNSPPGFLEARGGYGCAAIGGKYMGQNNTGTIIVESGEISATGGFHAAAIGGGWYGDGGTISISGGLVTATSGDYPNISNDNSSAIGGGFGQGGTAPAYAQSGGTVVAYGSCDDIGGYTTRAGSSVLITGGSLHLAGRDRARPAPSNDTERVWCVTITNLPPNAIVEDLVVTNGSSATAYGLGDLYADAEGKIHLWLPDGNPYIFTRASGGEWHVEVAGTNVVATYGPLFTLESLNIESVKVTADTVILVVSAVPEEWLVKNVKSLRVRAAAILPLPTGDNALLPAADVTAELNKDGTVTLTLPRTTDTSRFFRVEGE